MLNLILISHGWAFRHVRHPQTPGTWTFCAVSRYNKSLKQDFETNSIKSKYKTKSANPPACFHKSG